MEKTFRIVFIVVAVIALAIAGYLLFCRKEPKLTFIGHASIKIKSATGIVVYIDPSYSDGDYSEPANYILVTHRHDDHNNVSLCTKAENCKVITNRDSLKNGEYATFEAPGIKIEAVPAGGNYDHEVQYCVGYIVTVDGVSLYHAGDTSMLDAFKSFAAKKIDYAMYPVDGHFNMGPEEASEVAALVGATHSIPMHGRGNKFPQQCEEFTASGKIVMVPGETITLKKTR